MLCSIATGQKKESANQYHTHIASSSSGVLLKLIGSQVQARLNFLRPFCGSTRLHGQATAAKALDS